MLLRQNLRYFFLFLIAGVDSFLFRLLFKTQNLTLPPHLLELISLKYGLVWLVMTLILAFSLYWADRKKSFTTIDLIFLAWPLLFSLVIFFDPGRDGFRNYLTWSLTAMYIIGNSITAGLITCQLAPSDAKVKKYLHWVFYAALILFVLFFSLKVSLRAITFTRARDSCFFFQAMYNSLHGHGLSISCHKDPATSNFLMIHFSPILILLAPLYWLGRSTTTFFIWQVIINGLGVWYFRKLAQQELPDEIMADLLGLAYLSWVPLQNILLSGFREITTAIPLVIFAFYNLAKGRRGWFLFYLVLAMMCKEEMLVIAGLIGLFLLLVKKERWLGAVTVALPIMLGLVYSQVIVHHIFHGQYFYQSKYFGGASLGEYLTRLFSWRSFQYLCYIFSPFLGLAFLSGGYAIIFILPLMLQLVSGNFAIIYSYYSASLLPLVAIASLYGWKRLHPLSPYFRHFALGFILANILITNIYLGRTPLNPGFQYGRYALRPKHLTKMTLGRQIPPTAAVAVGEEIGPDLAFREHFYVLSSANISPDIFPAYQGKIDFIVIPAAVYYSPYLKVLADSGKWKVALDRDGLILLKRDNISSRANRQSLNDLIRQLKGG